MDINWFIWKTLVVLADITKAFAVIFDTVSKWVSDFADMVGYKDGYLVLNPAYGSDPSQPKYIPAPTPAPAPAPTPAPTPAPEPAPAPAPDANTTPQAVKPVKYR